MKKLIPYSGVVLMIKEVIPTLEKDGVVYAHRIKAEDITGRQYIFLERNGMPVSKYVGKPIECILEMVAFEYFEPDTPKEQLPENIMTGEYVRSDTGYKFIPELLEMIEGHEDEVDYDYSEDEYDRIAGDLFNSWGVTGLGLDIYQNKPMIKTELGVFLSNFERNEEIIEEWEYGQKIQFRYKGGLLRGFKPYEGKWEKRPIKHKYGVELEKGKSYVIGTPRFLEDR